MHPIFHAFKAKAPSRYAIHRTWVADGYLWATNGHACVRQPSSRNPTTGHFPDAKTVGWENPIRIEGIRLCPIPPSSDPSEEVPRWYRVWDSPVVCFRANILRSIYDCGVRVISIDSSMAGRFTIEDIEGIFLNLYPGPGHEGKKIVKGGIRELTKGDWRKICNGQ